MFEVLDKKIIAMSSAVKRQMESFFNNEDGLTVVEIVVVMGILILVAIIFRKELSNLVENLFKSIGTNANKVINNQDI